MVHRHHQGAEEQGQGSRPRPRARTTFDPKAPVNKDSGLVWHYGGDSARPDAGRNYLFGRTLSTCAVHDGLCLRRRLRRLSPLPGCQDGQEATGSTTWRRTPGVRRTGWTARSTSATRRARCSSSSTARRRRSWGRSSMDGKSSGDAGGGQRRPVRDDGESLQALGDQ